jgi:hypothetical protein
MYAVPPRLPPLLLLPVAAQVPLLVAVAGIILNVPVIPAQRVRDLTIRTP